MPRSSASRFLVSPKTRSASACLPHRYRAIISSPVACSRSGCAAASAVSSGTAAAACPRASSRSARSSIAVVRSSVSRRCSASANGPGTPAYGSPRQSASASSTARRAPPRSHVRAQPAGGGQAPLEVVRVQGAGAEPEQVAAAAGDERPGGRLSRPVGVAARPVRFDDAAQPGHIGVDAAFGAGGRLVSPDRVDQFAARDHPVRTGREHPEHRQLPRLASGLLPAVPPDRHRSENPYPQRNHRKPPLSCRVRPPCPRARQLRGATSWHRYGDYRTRRQASRKYLDRLEPARLSLDQRSCARPAMAPAGPGRRWRAFALPRTGVGAIPPGAHAASSRPPWHPPSFPCHGGRRAGLPRTHAEPRRQLPLELQCAMVGDFGTLGG